MTYRTPYDELTVHDLDLERQIANTRDRLVHATTAFGRRHALSHLQLLEGRRTPQALAWIKWKKENSC